MSFTGPLEDRLAIRELIDTYGDAVIRRNADDWANCWAEDGMWVIRGREIVGRAALRETWLGAMANYESVGFFANPGMVDIQGDTASGRTQTLEFLVPSDGGKRRAQVGLYEDKFVKRGGRWYFASRSFNIVQAGN